MLTSLPNLLTLSRILVIPIVIATFYIPGALSRWAGCVLRWAGFLQPILFRRSMSRRTITRQWTVTHYAVRT